MLINTITLEFILLFIPIVATKTFKWKHQRDRSPLIKGKLIWVDQGKKTQPFASHPFKIVGKPDFMFKIDEGILAVTYRNRKGNVYNNEIILAKATALAARNEGYQITHILIKTISSDRYFTLPRRDKALHKEIKPYIDLVRKAKQQERMKASPTTKKCDVCIYNTQCASRQCASPQYTAV